MWSRQTFTPFPCSLRSQIAPSSGSAWPSCEIFIVMACMRLCVRKIACLHVPLSICQLSPFAHHRQLLVDLFQGLVKNLQKPIGASQQSAQGTPSKTPKHSLCNALFDLSASSSASVFVLPLTLSLPLFSASLPLSLPQPLRLYLSFPCLIPIPFLVFPFLFTSFSFLLSPFLFTLCPLPFPSPSPFPSLFSL